MNKGEAARKRMPARLRLPSRVRVGDKAYSIDIVETMLRKGENGRIFYDAGVIQLAKRSNTCGRKYCKAEMTETFWHEMVHAILHDMGHPLYRNEDFVSRFARRLASAIQSARFK